MAAGRPSLHQMIARASPLRCSASGKAVRCPTAAPESDASARRESFVASVAGQTTSTRPVGPRANVFTHACDEAGSSGANNVERLQTSFLSVPQSVDQPPVFGSVICRARVSIGHTCNPLDFRGMTVRLHPHNHCTRTSRARISPRPSIEEEEEEFVGVFGLCRAWDQRADFTVEQSLDIRSKHPRICCVPCGFIETLH